MVFSVLKFSIHNVVTSSKYDIHIYLSYLSYIYFNVKRNLIILSQKDLIFTLISLSPPSQLFPIYFSTLSISYSLLIISFSFVSSSHKKWLFRLLILLIVCWSAVETAWVGFRNSCIHVFEYQSSFCSMTNG